MQRGLGKPWGRGLEGAQGPLQSQSAGLGGAGGGRTTWGAQVGKPGAGGGVGWGSQELGDSSAAPSGPLFAFQTETLLLQAERRALCACWPAGR